MQKVTKFLSQDNFKLIALFITIAIAVLSLIKPSESSGLSLFKFENADKIQHLIAYFFLTLSWLFAIKSSTKKIKVIITIIVLCVLYGTIIEVLQGIATSYRTADYRDIIANSVGITLAVIIFRLFYYKK